MTILLIKNYSRQVLSIALPAIAGLSSHIIVAIVDTAMVGRLENAKYSLAAMGIGVLATWAVTSFFSSLSTGTHVLVARREGEGDFLECRKILNTSLILSFLIGVVFGTIIFFGASSFTFLISADPIVEKLSGEYISIRFLSLPFFLMIVSYRGFFFGIGHTKIFMISGIILNIVNIFFNWVFIYGNLGAPKLGLTGAALASAIATVVDFFFYLYVTFLHYYRKKYKNPGSFNFDLKAMTQIIKLSLPVSFQNIFILVGFLSFIAIIGLIGTLEQAATQTVISSIFISLLPCFGFGIAAQTLVGNKLGLKEFENAKKLGNETLKLVTIFTLFIAFIFIVFPEFILRIITTDETIVQAAITPLRIAGFAQIFYGAAIVLANIIQTAGLTLYVMLSEVITNWIIFIPLVYLFGVVFDFGFVATWFSLPIYIISYLLLLLIKYASGKWMLKKV
ncbi:MAG: MATE family efflux transporter [Ignavibacteria bacterium]|nr:MATE family efflux transporter [Ignavibacteria bacterium]